MSALGTLVFVGILGSGTGVPHPVLLIVLVLVPLHVVTHLVRGLVCLVHETDGLVEHGVKVSLVTPLLELGGVVTILVTKEVGLHVPLNEHSNEQEALS